jgi:ATP-dependent DNA ligase
LARLHAPFDHPDWIFEPKLDGFRAIAYVEGGACRLVSRNGNVFKTFVPLAQAISQDLAGHAAILDGEIVRRAGWQALVLRVDAAEGSGLFLRVRFALAGWERFARAATL